MTPITDNSQQPTDVVPKFVTNALISGWLLLFGVRSLIVTPLMWNGTILPEQLATLDAVLLKVYLILFALTVLIAALRFVRAAQTQSNPAPSPESET